MSFNLIVLIAIVITGSCSYLLEVRMDDPATMYESTTPSPCEPCVCSVTATHQRVATCSNLGLTQVPKTIPSTINILQLDGNNITRLSSGEFSKFPNLTHLNISNNRIRDVMNDSFQGLPHLKCLHMKGNSIESPEAALSGLYSLEELYIDGSRNMTFGSFFQNMYNLTTLSMSSLRGLKQKSCNIHQIHNDTFKYVTHLKRLDLSICNLVKIDFGAFIHLKQIEELDISINNDLNFHNFMTTTYGLMNSSITVLKASALVKKNSICNTLLKKHTQHLKNTGLQKLYFDHNRLEVFESGALFNFPDTLWFISARYNRLAITPQVPEIANLTNLTYLHFGNDAAHPFPDLEQYADDRKFLCDSNSGSNCEPEIQEHLEYNRITFTSLIHYIPVPPDLQVLLNVNNPLNVDIPWIRFTTNNISTLNLYGSVLSKWIGPVEGLNKLKKLQLSNNFAHHVSTLFFSNFPNLKLLNISFNFIGAVMHKQNESFIFDNLTQLEVLDMSFNDIHTLPENIFRDLTSLKTLNLSNNALYLDLPLRLSHMKHLHFLDLSSNQVQWFSKILIQDLNTLAKSNNLTVQLLTNPIECTCRNLGFLMWILSSKVHFINVSDYTCSFENKTFSRIGEFKHTVNRLQQECANHLGLILGSVFAFCLALVIITGGTAYRYRWNLRYWYYAAKLRLKDQSLLDPEDDSFQFDAFISHSNEDEHFVVNEMRNHLELEAGMTLNIHDRDFVPGRDIASNILSAIQESRKTVVVLSNNFLESYWCLYELQMANMESIKTGRDVLIIIMYEDISTNQIPKEILYHLKTESYIGYPHQGDEDHRELFWRRLKTALKSN